MSSDVKMEGRFYYSVWGCSPIEAGYKLMVMLGADGYRRARKRNLRVSEELSQA